MFKLIYFSSYDKRYKTSVMTCARRHLLFHLCTVQILLFLMSLSVAFALQKANLEFLEFTNQPNSVLVAADGGRAVFKCNAVPNGVDIRWLYKGQPIDQGFVEGLRISRNRLVLRLPKLDAVNYDSQYDPSSSSRASAILSLQEGVFQCSAHYKGQVIVSQPAKLIVAQLDTFPRQDNISISAIEGNTAVIPCAPPYSVPNIVTEFDFNGTFIDKTTERYRLMPSGDLQIFNVRRSDAGIYRCIAHNPFLRAKTNASHIVQLSVTKPSVRATPVSARHNFRRKQQHQHIEYLAPKFIVTPKPHITIVMGSNVTMECAAAAFPAPNITWKKLNGNLPKWRNVYDGGNLILYNVRRVDEGTYVCSASTGSQEDAITATSVLDVQEVPQFDKKLHDRQVIEGERVGFESMVKGNPKPIITWLHNGALVSKDEIVSSGISIEEDGDSSRLIIARADAQFHNGIWQAFATNELGSTYVLSRLHVVAANASATAKENFDIRSEEDDDDDLVNNNAAGLGLLDDEDGDLFLTDPGRGKRKKNKNRKGIKMIPPSKPEVTRLSENSVMVRWDVPQNDGLPILFFKVQYREMMANGSKWHTVDEDIAPHIHSYAVTDLKTNAKYRFRIAAVYSNNDNKLGPNSNKFLLNKISPVKRPEHKPVILQVSPISQSAIQLQWEYDDYDSLNIRGFFIYYRSTHTAGDYLKITSLGSNTRSHIISHLLPETSYDIKMQAFNDGGPSDFSEISTCKTFPSSNVISTEPPSKPPGGIGPVSANDDATLYFVLGIAGAALLLVLIVCIIFCFVRSNKQTPHRPKPSSAKLPKEKHPNSHNSLNHLNHSFNSHFHHRSNGHISNTLVSSAASNGYLSRANTIDRECDHRINIRVNHMMHGSSTASGLNKNNSTHEIKSFATSNHHVSTNNVSTDATATINTLERRKFRRIDEHHPNIHHSVTKLNNRHNSFTRLNGTLERKRRSRTDLVTADTKDSEKELMLGRYNRTHTTTTNTATSNGAIVIMQSSC